MDISHRISLGRLSSPSAHARSLAQSSMGEPPNGPLYVRDADPFGSRLVTNGELFPLELVAGYRHIRIGTAKPYGLGTVCRRWCHDASPFQTDPVA
jgi:hypothetical protein